MNPTPSTTPRRRRPPVTLRPGAWRVDPRGKGCLVLDAQGAALLKAYDALRKRRRELATGYAGGVVLLLFREAPWLASCALALTAEAQHGDDGASYRSISAVARTACDVKGLAPELALSPGNTFDVDEATDWIEAWLEEEGEAIFEAFRESDDYDELELMCDRTRVQPLLDRLDAGSTVSGADACRALWPELL